MKICIALHQCMDLGGIINHTENLIAGLAHLGHDVHLREMVWKEKVQDQRKSGDDESVTGIFFNQGNGWCFPEHMRIPYKGSRLNSAVQKLRAYDLVIWTIPVPPKNKDNIGNTDWIHLHDLPSTKQIAFSHDGNASVNYPHILAISEKLDGLACVHHCALNTCEFVPVPRALILNPQKDPDRHIPDYSDRMKGWVSAQTFKAWKRVHELVGAVRFMPKIGPDERRLLIGKGIEYQYMTSEDKCKDAYYHADGAKFWEAAIANGMEHEEYQPYEIIEELFSSTLTVVDPSWSKRYSSMGGHYNRVVVEAMINGAVPIARKMGMGNEIFEAGRNYVEIPEGADHHQYADGVMEASFMSRRKWEEFTKNNLEVVKQFDRTKIAQQVIDLAYGNIPTLTGFPSKSLSEKSSVILSDHYGVI